MTFYTTFQLDTIDPNDLSQTINKEWNVGYDKFFKPLIYSFVDFNHFNLERNMLDRIKSGIFLNIQREVKNIIYNVTSNYE